MSKRRNGADTTVNQIMALVQRASGPDDVPAEAIRKAVLAAWHAGYAQAMQEALGRRPRPTHDRDGAWVRGTLAGYWRCCLVVSLPCRAPGVTRGTT